MTVPNLDLSMSPNPDHPPSTISSSMLQVVNYAEEFNSSLQSFLSANKISSLGFDYHVAAIMGPQSSGKSTLLNLLFGTSFRTMDESSGRYQVTQGVWLGRDVEKPIIVMDLEGTDSRERGEDAVAYERKSALFALALAEVLIVNVWAQDVGRYNAANMSLLKTVMELDLQLFFGGSGDQTAADGKRMYKTRLLFVLRDHVSSPFETLCNTLRADVDNIWDTIQKPPAAAGTSVTEYFDIDFFALPHKVLMKDAFYTKGAELKRRFHENEVFLPEYSRGVAADGFAAYAQNVWDTIRANRELDIPSQKEMLAHVRCEQIAHEQMDIFEESMKAAKQSLLPSSGDVELVAQLFESLRTAAEAAVKGYNEQAWRYTTVVAEAKGKDMKGKISADAKTMLDAQLGLAGDRAVEGFRSKAKGEGGSKPWQRWGSVQKAALDDVLKEFDEICGKDAVDESVMDDQHALAFVKASVGLARKRLVGVLATEAERMTGEVTLAARKHCEKTFRDAFKGPVGTVLDAAGEDVWDRASEVGEVAWEATAKEAREVYGEEGLGLEVAKVEEAVEDDIKPMCYERAVGEIKDAVGNPGNLLLRMTKRFDDTFRFDERGVPRHFGPTEDVETLFVAAREKGEELADLLGEVRLSGSLTRMRESARALDEELVSGMVVNEGSRAELRDKLKRQAGAVFMEAKRAQEAAKITSKIPLWLVGLLVILGWNELMAILRNPVLLVLTVLVVPAIYVGYTMDAGTVLGPAVKATLRPMVEQVKSVLDSVTEGGEESQTTMVSETEPSVSGSK